MRAGPAGAVVASLSLIAAVPARADLPEFCPTHAADGSLDTATAINKDDLAVAALSDAGVSLTLARRAAHLPPSDGATLMETLVIRAGGVCAAHGVSVADTSKQINCSPAELQALNESVNAFEDRLGASSFRLVGANTDPGLFFTDRGTQLYCRAPDPGTAPHLVGNDATLGSDGKKKPKSAWTHFRVRGGADDLIFPSGTAGYDSADKAKLSVGKDSGKATTSLVGAVGYAIALVPSGPIDPHHYRSAYVIPFFGIDLENSKKDGAARTTTSNVIRIGAAFDYGITTAFKNERGDWDAWDSELAATPQFVVNHHDHSQVAGINLAWQPAFWIVNARSPIGASRIAFNLIADARWNSGIFVKRGTHTDADSRDFSRLGGRAGLGFTTIENFPVPIDLTFTDTWMQALAGHPGHLSQLATDFTIYFNAKKNFGVDLSYARGRVEDLDDRDHKWSLALTAKY